MRIGGGSFEPESLVEADGVIGYRVHDHSSRTNAVRGRDASQQGVPKERAPQLIAFVVKINSESPNQYRGNRLVLRLALRQPLGRIPGANGSRSQGVEADDILSVLGCDEDSR